MAHHAPEAARGVSVLPASCRRPVARTTARRGFGDLVLPVAHLELHPARPQGPLQGHAPWGGSGRSWSRWRRCSSTRWSSRSSSARCPRTSATASRASSRSGSSAASSPGTSWPQSIQMSIPTLLGNGPLLQKVYFPSYAPVLGSMGAILVQTLIEMVIFAVILLLLGQRRAVVAALPRLAGHLPRVRGLDRGRPGRHQRLLP